MKIAGVMKAENIQFVVNEDNKLFMRLQTDVIVVWYVSEQEGFIGIAGDDILSMELEGNYQNFVAVERAEKLSDMVEDFDALSEAMNGGC